jgi:hypothetical protein
MTDGTAGDTAKTANVVYDPVKCFIRRLTKYRFYAMLLWV